MNLRLLFAVAALGALAHVPALPAAEVAVAVPTAPGAGVSVRLATPLAQLPHFGFLPVRAVVENLSARDGVWDLQFQVGNGGAAAPLQLVSRHLLAVPAGQTRETWLYVPVARAGFALNSGSGGAGFSGGVRPGPRVEIVKIPTGTKVTRTNILTSGRTRLATETEINTTTGELVTRTFDFVGKVTVSPATRPPAGSNVTYTIDQTSGRVTPRYSPTTGGFTVTVVTANAGTPPPAAPPVPPKVTITPTPQGLIVTRVTAVGTRTLTEETEFNTAALTILVTRTSPGGNSAASTRTVPTTPGTETTYTVNPTTGTYDTRTRLTTAGALAKMTVVVGPAVAAPAAPVPVAAAGPTGTPVVTPVSAEISGPGIVGLARVNLPNAVAANPMRPFAVAAALEAELRALLATEVVGAPNLAGVTVAQLPADWRVWSSFAGVVLPAADYAVLDAGRRAALRGWVGLGGQLFLVPAAAGAERREPVGAGRIVTLAAPLAETGGPALRTALELYGETVALPDRESLFLMKDTALGEEIKAGPADSGWVAIFLVVFAVVIGPVNLFVFAPTARRHRLFWTTPALALLGGLVLVGVIFFQDGTGGAGRRSTLVVLLPGQNQAAVFQEQAARTGFLVRRTFPLDDDAIFAPLAAEAENFRFGPPNTASRDSGQAGGDWFGSRATQAHALRRLAPTRGRVEFAGTAPGGAPIVESSLATVLRGFVLRDAAGKSWSAGELAPGRRVTLEPARGEADLGALGLGGSASLNRALAAAVTPVPGRWSAWGGETEVAPLATLASMRWTPTPIAYTGVAEPPAAAPAPGGAR